MSKKAIADALRERGVYNARDLLADGEPCIWYCAGETGRMASYATWRLWAKTREIENRAWYEDGVIQFPCNRKDRAETLEQAKAKAKEMFPDTELVPGPWRMTWIPRAAMDRAVAMIANEEAKR